MAYTDIIQEKTEKANLDVKKEALIVRSGIERMKNLIMSLLAYSRVGRGEMTKEKIELNSLLEEVMELLSANIKDRSVEIEISKISSAIFGNEMLIAQLFQNLIENAIKFCPKDRNPKIKITAKESLSASGFLEIAVNDNGIGIAPEFHEVVFEVFQRLNRREDYEGTGIGLSICKKIVEKHHGKIWLESKIDKGTTFLFTLPIFQKNKETT
jgi:signal transduction histidine kinase